MNDDRNLDQNARMWAMLGEISKQVEWPVNGAMRKMPAEDWKDVLTAGLTKSQRIAQGIEGGFVLLGERTSKYSKRRMAELIELIQFFGDSKGVKWNDPKLKAYEQYREAA